MDSLTEKLGRLAAAGIEIVPLPGLTRYFVLARDGYASLVERSGEGFGKIGAAGRVTGNGFEALVWRGEKAWFVAKEHEDPADSGQVELLRRFSEDLKRALAPR